MSGAYAHEHIAKTQEDNPRREQEILKNKK
jgi:hypothetical protein